MTKYFDSQRDKAIIDAGGFFCLSCLVGKPASEQSPDPRYCQQCYEYLVDEASRLTDTKRPAWVPKSPKIWGQKAIPVVGVGSGIMATVGDEKNTVAIIPSRKAKVTRGRRGRKQKALPVELIIQWASEGQGYKKIAGRLKVDHDIDISFRTVARVVKGERLLPALL